MLNRLLEASGNTIKPGFRTKMVRWLITCDELGGYTGIIPAGSDQYGLSMVCPDSGTQAQSSDGAHFLCDKLEVVALYGKDGEDSGRYKKQQKFCELIYEASVNIAYLKCAHKMLTSPVDLKKIRTELKLLNAKNSDIALVRVGKINPVNDSIVIEWWSNRRLSHSTTSKKMRCFVTGNLVTPMENHPKIAGLKKYGGRGQDNLVSFYAPSFTSYGLKESNNACMGEGTATSYAETLNQLIKDRSLNLGGSLCTYWFSHAVKKEEDIFSILQTPETPEPGVDSLPKKLLKSIQSAQRADLANNHYYTLTLSGAAGRVMVRDWMEGQFSELVEHIDQWFDETSIVGYLCNSACKLSGFERMLTSALPPKKPKQEYKDWVKPLGSLQLSLYQSAITGRAFPIDLVPRILLTLRTFWVNLDDSIQKNEKEMRANLALGYRRLGFLKAYQIRNKGDKHMKAHLNPDHPEPAYQCGRLLAILARLQRRAQGDVGAGVVQRYYSAASQTPALTIGRLVSNAKNHLSKLDGGLQHWYENQIAEVMAQIDSSIPKTLDLEKQSLFALGYYQQIAKLNAGKDKTTDHQGDDQ